MLNLPNFWKQYPLPSKIYFASSLIVSILVLIFLFMYESAVEVILANKLGMKAAALGSLIYLIPIILFIIALAFNFLFSWIIKEVYKKDKTGGWIMMLVFFFVFFGMSTI